MKKMTFTDFQATRTVADNLRDITRDDSVNPTGFVYAGNAFIEFCDDGAQMLTLYNEGWITPGTSLEKMEAILYAWCLTECPDDMGVTNAVHRFLCELQDAMGLEKFADAMLANRAEPMEGVCHMHDHADANQCALNATGNRVDRAAQVYERARPFLRG